MKYQLLSTLLSFAMIPGILMAQEMRKNYVFEVLLDEKPIGIHTFDIHHKNEITNVSIKAEFDVKFLFLNLYSYQHKNSETWENNCLSQLKAFTNDNGNEYSVNAQKLENKFSITSGSETKDYVGCARSFAYWNPNLLKTDELLNPQTGEIKSAAFNSLGLERIFIQNQQIEAQRFQLETDDEKIDLWYDHNNEWIALQSTIGNDKVLRYERKMSDNES